MISYNDFKAQVINKGYDVDGSHGYQCWDGYAYYCQYLGVPYANCTVTGYARDIWEQRTSNGMLTNFDEVSELQTGDVVVFRAVADITPDSHVAIFDSDAGNGYGNFLGQNQGGAVGPDGGGVFNITSLPYLAMYATAFHPKAFNTSTQTENEVRNTMDNTVFLVRLSEDFDEYNKKGNIYFFNVGDRSYHHMNGDEYNTAKAIFTNIKTLEATKQVNYLQVAINLLQAKKI